MSNKFIISLK